MTRNTWGTAELEITLVVFGSLPVALPASRTVMESHSSAIFEVFRYMEPFVSVVDPGHYLMRERGELTVSAGVGNSEPMEVFYGPSWDLTLPPLGEVAPGETRTLQFDISYPGAHTLQDSGSRVFHVHARGKTLEVGVEITLVSASTALTLSDEPPPPPVPDGPATWVPLADADVAFQLHSIDPEVVRLEGSTVVCDDLTEESYFQLLFDPPQRVRLTVLSYTSTALADGQYDSAATISAYKYDPYVNLWVENEAHPLDSEGAPYQVRQGFSPNQLDSLVPVSEAAMYPARSYYDGEPLQDRYEILIEIDVPGGGRAACFWTDLVGVSQVCGAQ